MLSLVSRFLPPLALMAFIYWLSSLEGLSSGLGVWDTVLRKGAHMTEFGLLWLLWWRALRWGNPLPALGISLGYAIFDELHQASVAGRVGSPFDVAFDAAGIAFAGVAAVLWLARRPRPREPEPQSQPRSVA